MTFVDRITALDFHQDMEGYLDGVISLVQEVVQADVLYIAAGGGATTTTPRWSTCRPARELSRVHTHLSTGVMQACLAEGEIVHTPAAMLDPRFGDRQSVQGFKLGRVLCMPIGDVGILYLHRRDGTPFAEPQLKLLEGAGGLIGPVLDRLVRALRLDAPDATRDARRGLDCQGLVGASPALGHVLQRIRVCARTPAPVLLLGETGTGKSTIARVLHRNSGRRGAFVAVECTQLKADRLVADLFGARAGSYTGIRRDTPGLVEQARGGTLFLDEIGELDADLQGQLLRFLDERRYRWLGDTEDRHAPDVRIVAATHVDLEAAVARGSFRSDLYFRLKVFPIHTPDLRERLDDLPYLAHELVGRIAEEWNLAPLPVSASALAALDARRWPGNLRELDNTLRAALLTANAQQASAVRAEHLFEQPVHAEPEPASLVEQVDAFKRRVVLRALEQENWNRTRAAHRLGIGRSSFYELITSLGIDLSGDPDTAA